MPDTAPAADITEHKPIGMVDLGAQRARIGARIEAAVGRVLRHGAFINGPEVADLEQRLAAAAGIEHVVSCGSGTEALVMGLMALDIGPGDAVIVPSFTFTATAEAVVLAGATPVFADVDRATYTMTPASLAAGIAAARAAGLKPKAAIPVDLFGQPADYAELGHEAAKAGLVLFADAAQSFGASLGNKKVGALAPITATSFYPSKPFGGYGDGGAVFTGDGELATRLRQIRTHGQRNHRDDVVRIGMTARLDTIQAAVLIEKLAILDDEIHRRQVAAERYASLLAGRVTTPTVLAGATSVWAQYTVTSPERDRIAAALKVDHIATSLFYPLPVHRQGPYRNCPVAEGGLPVTSSLANEVVSLPMHPYLDPEDQARVASAVARALA